jgi:adenosylcobinamide-phosphate synthase
MIYPTATQLTIGAAMDLAIGDPQWLPHPVQGIGLLVRGLEDALRRISAGKLCGAILAVVVIAAVSGFVALTLRWGDFAAAIYWIFSCLAIRSLDDHAVRVIGALKKGDIEQARALVGRIVGRDTKALPAEEITRAVFETVAENMSDGIVAPLFFLALFGVPGMVAYKAINTMDSMIGYKNERYIRFGWAAARIDDVANYIPARITAGLIVLSAFLLRLRWRAAVSTVLRDARLQPSPNSGYPEAALAGALGVRLGGLNYYFGRPVQKPFLGDADAELQWNRFPSVRGMMYAVAALCYVLVTLWLLK